jgi:exosortase A
VSVLAFSWIATIALFWDTVVSIVSVWSHSKTHEHGFLVLPIFLYLIWRVRGQVKLLQPHPNYWGLALLFAVSVAWLLGRLVNIGILQQFALVAMLSSIAWVMLGTEITRALLFPMLFLFFGVPVGEEIVPVLQDYTAWFVVKALQASGVPVFWEGRLLTIPSGTWEVHESCSGIRYVMASLTFGYLYAGLTYRRWSRRTVFFVASAIVPIIANGLRAYAIVMLAHFSSNSIAVGVDHFIYGWLFFGFVVAPLILVGERWREKPWHPEPVSVRISLKEQSGPTDSGVTVVFAAFIGLVILATAPLSVAAIQGRPSPPTVIRPIDLFVAHPWEGTETQASVWYPRFIGASAEQLRHYKSGAYMVDVYVAYYDQEQNGRELISSQNDIVDRKRWTPTRVSTRRVFVDGMPLNVKEVTARSRVLNQVTWSWYWIDGRFTANPYYAKLLQLQSKIFHGQAGGAAIVLAAPYRDNESEAIRALSDFLEHWEEVGRTLSRFRRPE